MRREKVTNFMTYCRSYYTRRKFRPIYAKVMNSYANACRKSSTYQYQRYAGANSLSLVAGLLPFTTEMALFEFPFNELLVSCGIITGSCRYIYSWISYRRFGLCSPSDNRWRC